MTKRSFTLAALLLSFAVAHAGSAQAPAQPPAGPTPAPPAAPPACWMPTVEERTTAGDVVPVTSPKVAGIRRAAQAADAMLRANPHLQKLPDVRLRNRIEIGAGSPRPAHVDARAYLPPCWEGECGLHPKAEGLRCSAGLSIIFNSTDPLLDWPLQDDQLRATQEPERVGELQGYPLFRKGPATFALLSVGGRLPWMPLPVAEYLDFQERDVLRRLAAVNAERAETAAAAEDVDVAEMEEAYEEMKAIDPEGAELFRARMQRLMQEIPRQIASRFAEQEATLQKERAELRALRAALTPAQAAAQARAGSGRFGLPAPGQDPGKLPGWVKDDPAFGWDDLDANRVQLILVSRAETFPQWSVGLQQAFETLDYPALAALLR